MLYESVGTVRYVHGSQATVVFVPDCDHHLKHGDQNLAVFIGKRCCKCASRCCCERKVDVLAEVLCDGGVKLCIVRQTRGWRRLLQAAALKQSTVVVEVKKGKGKKNGGAGCGGKLLRLVRITVPAK